MTPYSPVIPFHSNISQLANYGCLRVRHSQCHSFNFPFRSIEFHTNFWPQNCLVDGRQTNGTQKNSIQFRDESNLITHFIAFIEIMTYSWPGLAWLAHWGDGCRRTIIEHNHNGHNATDTNMLLNDERWTANDFRSMKSEQRKQRVTCQRVGVWLKSRRLNWIDEEKKRRKCSTHL